MSTCNVVRGEIKKNMIDFSAEQRKMSLDAHILRVAQF